MTVKLRHGMFETELADMNAVKEALARGQVSLEDELWDPVVEAWRPVRSIDTLAAQLPASSVAKPGTTATAGDAEGAAGDRQPMSLPPVGAPGPQVSARRSSHLWAWISAAFVIVGGAAVVALLVVRAHEAVAVIDCAKVNARLRQCSAETVAGMRLDGGDDASGVTLALLDEAIRSADATCQRAHGRVSDAAAVNACMQFDDCGKFASCVAVTAFLELEVGIHRTLGGSAAPPPVAPAASPPAFVGSWCSEGGTFTWTADGRFHVDTALWGRTTTGTWVLTAGNRLRTVGDGALGRETSTWIWSVYADAAGRTTLKVDDGLGNPSALLVRCSAAASPPSRGPQGNAPRPLPCSQSCSGCCAGERCLPGVSVVACGMGGSTCVNCTLANLGGRVSCDGACRYEVVSPW